MNLRPARRDDAPLLSTIAHASKARWGYPREWLEAWDADLTITPDDIERMLVFVAELTNANGEKAVGVAALERRPDDWSLEHFWIAPSAEGRGVGRALFAHVVREVAAHGGATITIASDPNAVGFYVRMGARVEGDIRAPMPGDESRTLTRLSYSC